MFIRVVLMLKRQHNANKARNQMTNDNDCSKSRESDLNTLKY